MLVVALLWQAVVPTVAIIFLMRFGFDIEDRCTYVQDFYERCILRRFSVIKYKWLLREM